MAKPIILKMISYYNKASPAREGSPTPHGEVNLPGLQHRTGPPWENRPAAVPAWHWAEHKKPCLGRPMQLTGGPSCSGVELWPSQWAPPYQALCSSLQGRARASSACQLRGAPQVRLFTLCPAPGRDGGWVLLPGWASPELQPWEICLPTWGWADLLSRGGFVIVGHRF
ncbi:hypothetical protein E2320_005555 [Naja naja]|nr:hypothetical protein E2320_005555 [Naja naja]